MLNKQTIANLAKRITRSEHSLQTPSIIHPAREWGTGLVVAVAILIGCITWSTTTYLKYRDISVSETEVADSNIVVYRESLVDSVLVLMEERLGEYDKLLVVTPLEELLVESSNMTVSTSSDKVSLEGLNTATSSLKVATSSVMNSSVSNDVVVGVSE